MNFQYDRLGIRPINQFVGLPVQLLRQDGLYRFYVDCLQKKDFQPSKHAYFVRL